MTRRFSETDQPLCAALPALRGERDLTYRALATLTRSVDPDGAGLTHSHIANLTAAREQPSMRALELLAACFELDAAYFPEFRLDRLRRELDPREVGFERAYRTYQSLHGGARRAAGQ